MVSFNLFENMIELATALAITSSNDEQRLNNNSNASSGEEFKEQFCALTKNFHEEMLEAVEQLNQAIDEKIRETYNLLRRTKWASESRYQFNVGRKSNVEATSYRLIGDRALQNGYDQCVAEAQAAYTISLSFAVCDSEEEAITLAKRCELWYQTKKYESCLLDTNRALKSDQCPVRLRVHLEGRRVECTQKIEEENRGKVDLADQFLADDCLARLYPSVCDGFFIPRHSEKNQMEPKYVEVLKTIPTQTLAISYEPRMGRILVANRDIEAGEIISRDAYFSIVLKPEKALNHCAYCLVKCDALIPCPTCVYELYCGTECRTKAFHSYHEFECKIWPYFLDELEGAENNDFVLAVRTFLVGTNQGADLRTLMKDVKFRDLFPAEISYDAHVFDGHSYATVCHEEAKAELLTATDLLSAIRFIRVLRRLSFFGDHAGGDECAQDLTEVEVFAIKLLVKHLTSIKTNSFVVTERVISSPFALKQKCHRIGEGTLEKHSLINHSCDPNVADFTRRRDNFLYALRPIKASEQIFISYGYCYFDGTPSDRLRQQSLYGFRCSCRACVNNWPTIADLQRLPTQYLTKNSDLIASIETKAKVVWGDPGCLRSGSPIQRPWKMMCDFCAELHAHVSAPSLMIVRCENFIEGCMRYLSNFYVDSSEEAIESTCTLSKISNSDAQSAEDK